MFHFSILSHILSVSEDIQQFRRNLIGSSRNVDETLCQSISIQHNKTTTHGFSKDLDNSSAPKDSNNSNCNKVDTSPSVSSNSCKDSIKVSRKTNSTSEHPRAHMKTYNNIPDDPSAPTYPPRSPSSDIVPNELPPCHLYPKLSRSGAAEGNCIDQLDGHIENPKDRYAIGYLPVGSTEDRIPKKACKSIAPEYVSENAKLAKTHDFRTAPGLTSETNGIHDLLANSDSHLKDIIHCSSSSSVSSIGSDSSSARESLSDAVSIISCSSSGYGSEQNDIISDFDSILGPEFLSLNRNHKFSNERGFRDKQHSAHNTKSNFIRPVCNNKKSNSTPFHQFLNGKQSDSGSAAYCLNSENDQASHSSEFPDTKRNSSLQFSIQNFGKDNIFPMPRKKEDILTIERLHELRDKICL